MMTPFIETKSTAIVPYNENKGMLDFLLGGTPQKQKNNARNKRGKGKR